MFTYDEAMKIFSKETLNDTESYTVTGWVARDSSEDDFVGTGLILHDKKPTRVLGNWSSQTIAMHLPKEYFPSLKWEDDPLEVEISIKQKTN